MAWSFRYTTSSEEEHAGYELSKKRFVEDTFLSPPQLARLDSHSPAGVCRSLLPRILYSEKYARWLSNWSGSCERKTKMIFVFSSEVTNNKSLLMCTRYLGSFIPMLWRQCFYKNGSSSRKTPTGAKVSWENDSEVFYKESRTVWNKKTSAVPRFQSTNSSIFKQEIQY